MAFGKMGCPPRIPPCKWHLLDVSWIFSWDFVVFGNGYYN
jgi:hypothetical protein